MERNKLVAIVVIVVIVGGVAVLLLPSLTTPTEYRFAEGESGRISLDIRGIANCDITFRFVDDPTLKFSYEQEAGPEGATVAVTEVHEGRYDFRDTVDGVANITSLSITLGSEAYYWIVINGDTLDVDIHYNEFSTIQEGMYITNPGGRLNLTIDSDATVGGEFDVTTVTGAIDLDIMNLDISLPDGASGSVRPVANDVTIHTNDGWTFSAPYYIKGSGTLLSFQIVTVSFNAWLR